MKLVTYFNNGPRIGIVADDTVWDLREIYAAHLFETERTPHYRVAAERLVPDDMALFVRMNHGRLDVFANAIAYAQVHAADLSQYASKLSATRLLPPVVAPSKVVCCGNSYHRYLADLDQSGEVKKSEWPQDVKISFFKPSTALIGHNESIMFPPDSEKWDYENELTVVIGKTCSNIAPEQAADHIFGYTILNDACVRDIPSWAGRYDSPRGKAGDTFAPLGPCIVPGAYLKKSPNDLRIRTWVDDELRQDDRTSGLLWPVERIIAYVSRYIKLLPGDVVSTGSTTGNALITGKWLKPGQIVRCEIEGIGVLENKVGRKTWDVALQPLGPRN